MAKKKDDKSPWGNGDEAEEILEQQKQDGTAPKDPDKEEERCPCGFPLSECPEIQGNTEAMMMGQGPGSGPEGGFEDFIKQMVKAKRRDDQKTLVRQLASAVEANSMALSIIAMQVEESFFSDHDAGTFEIPPGALSFGPSPGPGKPQGGDGLDLSRFKPPGGKFDA